MPLAVRNISLHLVDIDLTDHLAVLHCLVWSIHMDVHDMFCNHLRRSVRKWLEGKDQMTNAITLFIVFVFDNEYHVEPR